MSTETESASPRSEVIRTGKVIAVCYSPELINGVGKQTHASGEVTRLGIPGDRHYGETRVSSRGVVPNDRPITIVGQESLVEVCGRLGVPLVPPGGLGENILIEGMGDLSDVLPGDVVRVTPAEGGEGAEPAVVLLARKQNEPCSNLQIYHRLMTKELFGKRGVICTVEKEGTLRVGDRVELLRATQKTAV
jgi:MOSC domain-containing protein YiiM